MHDTPLKCERVTSSALPPQSSRSYCQRQGLQLIDGDEGDAPAPRSHPCLRKGCSSNAILHTRQAAHLKARNAAGSHHQS
jgi:hypothetical protein